MGPEDKDTDGTVTDNASGQQPTLLSIDLSNRGKLTGKTLNGRYTIVDELGCGGVGMVYLARDKRLMSKLVVVKVLLEESLRDEWVVNKFRQEIEALSLVDHPCIVKISDAGEMEDGKPYLVMQYVEGVSLRSLITPEGLDLLRAAGIIRQVGRALSCAHEHAIIHRDLKPENIMLGKPIDGEEQVKVIDFGIAKIKNSVFALATPMGLTAGTIAYMSPEQLLAKPVSPASDTYALAVIVYELLTGRRPHNPDSMFDLLDMQREGVRLKPKDLRPSLPEAAQEIILKALSFDPAQRQPQTRDFGDQLAKVIEDSVQSFESPGPTTPETKQARHKSVPSVRLPPGRAAIISAGVFCLVVVLSLIAFIWFKPALRESPGSVSSTKGAVVPGATIERAGQRTLAYSMIVQKYRNGKPFEKPFPLPGEINFEKDYRVQVLFSSPQQGHLYVVNEGPLNTAGLPDYVVLFPDYKEKSLVSAGKRIMVPPEKEPGIEFDAEQGLEKMWVVWAAEPVLEIEAVQKYANPKDRGVIKDPVEIKALRDFLAVSRSEPVVQRPDEATQTTVEGSGQTLVYLLKLQHH